jgi:DNA-binding NtrC family response regulator
MTEVSDSKISSGSRVAHEVLVVDADLSVHRGLLAILQPEGIHLSAQTEPGPALEMCETKFFGVILIDLDTPGPSRGIEVLRAVRRRSPQSTVLMLSPRKSFEGAVEALRAGATDMIWKSPDQVDYLKSRLLGALAEVRARDALIGILGDVRSLNEDVLKVLMAADRRAQDAEDRLAGRDPRRLDVTGEIPILCVDGDDRLYKALVGGQIEGFTFTYAQSGGEAFDRISSQKYQIALVGPTVPDLPSDMVVRTIKQQAPEMIAISYEPNGRLAIVEKTRSITIVDKFTSAKQLVDRLNELGEGYRAKARERRYLQGFRERHYEFLRRLSDLRHKLNRTAAAAGEGEAGSSGSVMASLSLSARFPSQS